MIPGLHLTTRGRGMLVAGAGLACAGAVAGSLAVLTAAAFTVALVAVAVVTGLVRRSRLSAKRSQVPSLLNCGERFGAALRLGGSAGQGRLVITGLVPPWASPAPGAEDVMALDAGPAGRTVALPALAARRGVYRWDPVRVALPDPFGIAAGVVLCPSDRRTVIWPHIEPLGALQLPVGDGGASGFDNPAMLTPAALREAGRDALARPFVPGDEARRIHWPATARVGAPMVRGEEATPTRRAAILLDRRGTGYRTGEGSERAVVVAASICVHLLRLGWTVSLRNQAGTSLTCAAWLEGRRGEAEALTALAEVAADDHGEAVVAGPKDQLDAVFAVTGIEVPSTWAFPPITCITCERPAPGARDGSLRWDGTGPLACLWPTGSMSQVLR